MGLTIYSIYFLINILDIFRFSPYGTDNVDRPDSCNCCLCLYGMEHWSE